MDFLSWKTAHLIHTPTFVRSRKYITSLLLEERINCIRLLVAHADHYLRLSRMSSTRFSRLEVSKLSTRVSSPQAHKYCIERYDFEPRIIVPRCTVNSTSPKCQKLSDNSCWIWPITALFRSFFDDVCHFFQKKLILHEDPQAKFDICMLFDF